MTYHLPFSENLAELNADFRAGHKTVAIMSAKTDTYRNQTLCKESIDASNDTNNTYILYKYEAAATDVYTWHGLMDVFDHVIFFVMLFVGGSWSICCFCCFV